MMKKKKIVVQKNKINIYADLRIGSLIGDFTPMAVDSASKPSFLNGKHSGRLYAWLQRGKSRAMGLRRLRRAASSPHAEAPHRLLAEMPRRDSA